MYAIVFKQGASRWKAEPALYPAKYAAESALNNRRKTAARDTLYAIVFMGDPIDWKTA